MQTNVKHMNLIKLVAKQSIELSRGLCGNFTGTSEELWKLHGDQFVEIITNSVDFLKVSNDLLWSLTDNEIKSHYPTWLVEKLKAQGKDFEAKNAWTEKTVKEFWGNSTDLQKLLIQTLLNKGLCTIDDIKRTFQANGYEWVGEKNLTLAGTKGTLHSRAVKLKFPYLILENKVNKVWHLFLSDEFSSLLNPKDFNEITLCNS